MERERHWKRGRERDWETNLEMSVQCTNRKKDNIVGVIMCCL